jgi:hypothetical protein
LARIHALYASSGVLKIKLSLAKVYYKKANIKWLHMGLSYEYRSIKSIT